MKSWTTKNNLKIIHASGIFFNSYLIFNGEKYILIDTGRTYAWSRLCRDLEALGVNENNLVALVLTHTHFDHAENAAAIKGRYGAKIIVHESEAEYLSIGDSPLPKGSMLLTRPLMKLVSKKGQPLFRYGSVTADIVVDEMYDLNELGFNAYIIHTPGHTKGSMSVIVDDEIALVGDAIVGVFKFDIFPPFADEPRMLIKSWGKLLDTGCRLFIPAHGTENRREILEKQYCGKIKKLSDVL